jgi:hypothetical protein
MSQPVRIEAILEGMDLQSDDAKSYLHRPTGRVLTISDDALAAAENADRQLVSPEELAEARALLGAEEEYLDLPDRFEINEYRMMERFATTLGNDEYEEVARALHGHGAFRRFKDTVRRLGIANAWYAYRDDGYRRIAMNWCEANGLTIE